MGSHEFLLNGSEVVPHGINSYPLLQHIGRQRWQEVEDIFAQASDLGRLVVRTNAFMDGGTSPARIRDDQGVIREEGLVALDALLAEAGKANVRLLLVLTNNWEDFGGAPAIVKAIDESGGLPKDAFWSDPRAIQMQRDYVRTLVGRINSLTGKPYRTDPAIFAWELANEPRCTTAEYCGPATLVDWASTMSQAVRDAGAMQPIAWGGAGYLNRYGESLEAIAEAKAVDILTVHAYAEVGAVNETVRVLRNRMEVGKRYQMPLLVEELGYHALETTSDDERNEAMRSLLAVVHAAGFGALPWMIGETDRTDYDGYLVRPTNEQTWDTLRCNGTTIAQAP